MEFYREHPVFECELRAECNGDCAFVFSVSRFKPFLRGLCELERLFDAFNPIICTLPSISDPLFELHALRKQGFLAAFVFVIGNQTSQAAA
jgi:hypothetical protein